MKTTTRTFIKQLGLWSTAGAAGALAPMADAATTGEPSKEVKLILQAEHELIRGYLGELPLLARWLADDVEYAEGNKEPERVKAKDLRDVRTGVLKFRSLQLEKADARIYGNTALARGIYATQGTFEEKDISGRYRFVDVFLKRRARWQVVAMYAMKLT